MRAALFLLVMLVAGCTDAAEVGPASPSVVQVTPGGIPEVGRLGNDSWPGMARVIASLTAELANKPTPILRDGSGGQFENYRGAAADDLARGWLREAPRDAAAAFDLIYRGDLEAMNASPSEVASTNNATEIQLTEELREDDSSTCRAEAGALLAASVVHHEEIDRMRQAGSTEADLLQQESFRRGRLHVIGALADAECESVGNDEQLDNWVRRVLRERSNASPLAADDDTFFAFRERMTSWAEDNGLENTASRLRLEDAFRAAARIWNASASEAPSFEKVASVASNAIETDPQGLAAFAYAVGTYTYDQAAHGREQGIVDPRMRWIAFAAFAAATRDPDGASSK